MDTARQPTEHNLADSAHFACEYCRDVLIRPLQLPSETVEDPKYYHLVTFTREDLAQSVRRDCILAQWIVALIIRALVMDETDLAVKKRVRALLNLAADDLAFLSSQGQVLCAIWISPRDWGKGAFFQLDYMLEDTFVDDFWAVEGRTASEECVRPVELSKFTSYACRIFTLPGKESSVYIFQLPGDLYRQWTAMVRWSDCFPFSYVSNLTPLLYTGLQ
jgi:hypothetical protein